MPSFGEIAQLLTALSAVGALIVSILNRRTIKNVGAAVEQVHVATNSMKDELVHEVRESAHAAGFLKGRELI